MAGFVTVFVADVLSSSSCSSYEFPKEGIREHRCHILTDVLHRADRAGTSRRPTEIIVGIVNSEVTF